MTFPNIRADFACQISAETCKKHCTGKQCHDYWGVRHQCLRNQSQIHSVLNRANTLVVANGCDFLWSRVPPLVVFKNLSAHLRQLLEAFCPTCLPPFFAKNLLSVYHELNNGNCAGEIEASHVPNR